MSACDSCRRYGNRRRELNRRAGRYGADGRVTADQLLRLVTESGSVCHWCDRQVDFDAARAVRPVAWDATFDHVVPLSDGGRGTIENIVVACYRCNEQRNRNVQGRRAA